MPATAATMVPLAFVLRSADGIWKSVVEPVLEMEKSVEMAHCALDDDMTKSVPVFGVEVGDVKILSGAYGVLVPIPRAPVAVKVEVAVAPNAAVLP